jgi:type VI secretion system protein ImpH
MATKKRRTRTVVRKNLLEYGCGFNFFKAVHLLEGFSNGKKLGKKLSPGEDPVRFRVEPGFSFPASDIQVVRNGNKNPDPVMTVNFMGLIGPQGVLPNWYNTHALELKLKKDCAFADFLDLFHHRILSLFYLAWKKYRLTENYLPDGSDGITQGLAGFIGMGKPVQNADLDFVKLNRRRLIYFSGLVSRTVPTAKTVETIIANATGVPVRVKQFVVRMLPIHDRDKTRMGRANSTLGKDALCGGRICDAASFFTVELGPLSWKKYLSFQSRSRNLKMVQKLISFVVGVEYEFDIHLILMGREIPSLPLGGGKQGSPVLGRTVMVKRPDKVYQKNVVIKESMEMADKVS